MTSNLRANPDGLAGVGAALNRIADRLAHAVDDLDRWCGHSSPHARLIAKHLTAHGLGYNINAGTPHADEACTIAGLREQLRRLDGSAPGGA